MGKQQFGLSESVHSAGLWRGARTPGVVGMGAGFASSPMIHLVIHVVGRKTTVFLSR